MYVIIIVSCINCDMLILVPSTFYYLCYVCLLLLVLLFIFYPLLLLFFLLCLFLLCDSITSFYIFSLCLLRVVLRFYFTFSLCLLFYVLLVVITKTGEPKPHGLANLKTNLVWPNSNPTCMEPDQPLLLLAWDHAHTYMPTCFSFSHLPLHRPSTHPFKSYTPTSLITYSHLDSHHLHTSLPLSPC